jgi:hypothetical protein
MTNKSKAARSGKKLVRGKKLEKKVTLSLRDGSQGGNVS